MSDPGTPLLYTEVNSLHDNPSMQTKTQEGSFILGDDNNNGVRMFISDQDQEETNNLTPFDEPRIQEEVQE